VCKKPDLLFGMCVNKHEKCWDAWMHGIPKLK
jgi:hypothetical protein